MTTTALITPEMTVAAVAERYPSTLPVFARFGVDLCCGGSRTLAFVAQAHGLDLETLLGELGAAIR